jgi:hypothetical protein
MSQFGGQTDAAPKYHRYMIILRLRSSFIKKFTLKRNSKQRKENSPHVTVTHLRTLAESLSMHFNVTDNINIVQASWFGYNAVDLAYDMCSYVSQQCLETISKRP